MKVRGSGKAETDEVHECRDGMHDKDRGESMSGAEGQIEVIVVASAIE
jgi:hypothetical protein